MMLKAFMIRTNGRRSIEYLGRGGVADSGFFKGTPIWLVGKCILLVTFAAFAAPGGGCVETAECDEDVRCPSGQICYELVCRTRCESDADCGDEQRCLPCEEDDGAALIDHCFERRGNACLPRR